MNRKEKRSKSDSAEITFRVPELSERVRGLLQATSEARALYVMAHGAGAGMSHPFLELLAANLARERIASFRYQFPYMEKKTGRPDSQPALLATVRAAVETARRLAPSLPLVAGGKSMGGRMTSLAASEEALPDVKGIAFVGFPLHPPGNPSIHRAAHLANVKVPMLFLQGTRDKLADLKLLEPVCSNLGKRSTLHVIEGADHSFHLLESTGRTDEDVSRELAQMISQWAARL